MLKVKVKDVVDSFPAMQDLARVNFNAKISFAIAKALRKVTKEVEIYDNTRVKTCKKYGKVDKKSNQYVFPDDKKDVFDKEMDELMNSTIELNGIRQLSIDELGNVQIPPAALNGLDWLIVERAVSNKENLN
ncbi:MAG: hypothetical protein Unbinned7913contig1002_29 [Prokaryotic dsDNA virus sp.]|jgi:hypothetical protein|nr:hypothetical protein [Parcubacteria group bacterium]QDP51274.1 MAG: hypothetical protein Unbinned7913contig1002_29 [Prokaryotic dsDNA virus sp.]|tara:strand:- start:632 stop:1027 length:396 start_codon:yes stop_codon:yes gene_type:complete